MVRCRMFIATCCLLLVIGRRLEDKGRMKRKGEEKGRRTSVKVECTFSK